jgi:prepilin-type N-terminal cleavage/methylation domain-containing protein
MHSTQQHGFTLVELSIVLTIIGLIVSGILAGKSLIEVAKIRSQITQLENYKKAYYTFKLKYDAVPGDMMNASDYWAGVTNGNGDGLLNSDVDNYNNSERTTLFQHLASAGLIKGSFNNTMNINTGYPALKLDFTKGMVSGGFISPFNAADYQLTDAELLRASTAALFLSVSNPSAWFSEYNDFIGVFTPMHAIQIDNKIDDSIARNGIFKSHRAWRSTIGDCLDAIDGNYLITNEQKACMGQYILEK